MFPALGNFLGAIQAYGIHTINTIAQRIPQVYLRLTFLSPEPVAEFRPFPTGFPVTVRYGLDLPIARRTERVFTVQANGDLTFPAWDVETSTTFTLRYESPVGQVAYIGSEPRGAVQAQTYFTLADAHVPHVDVPGAANPLGRYFSIPAQWSLRQLDWYRRGGLPLNQPPDMGGNARFTAATGDIERLLRDDIGTALNPVEFVLDPHWTFWRFLFFDRYYGHSHHTRQISIPPVYLEGFRANPDADADPADTICNWNVGADPKDALQSLPWILRRNAGGAALPAMTGATCGLRFRTHQVHRTMIHSQDENTRPVVDMDSGTVAHVNALKPGPDRLRYYDLPRIWKSRRYFTRQSVRDLSGAAKFFHTLTQPELAVAENRGTPLLFALDDLVLYESVGATPSNPLPTLIANEHLAIFNHRFDDTLPNSTQHGLYKLISPPADPIYTPGSDSQPTAENYTRDYPDWTRLVVAKGSLFDVFDQRTPDHAGADRVVGARAAVRWADGITGLAGVLMESPPGLNFLDPAGRAVPNTEVPMQAAVRAPAVDSFFHFQPFFHQTMSVRYTELFSPPNDSLVGRFDQALLRCCDVQGADEIAINLNYLKSFFDFTVPSSPPLPANLTNPGGQAQWALDLSMNVARRWNGNDPAVNPDRAQLLPRVQSPPHVPNAAPPLKIFVVWFPQSVALDRAHFDVDVVNIDRDNRGSLYGSGASGPGSFQEQSTLTHEYAAAHESGHMYGLPDEYNERWDGASYDQLSFKQHLPGDPYEPDGRWENGPYLSPPISPMMNGMIRIRNRYFWHSAEWVRMQLDDVPMRVKLGAHDNFYLPPHPFARRSYYQWPVANMSLTMNNITTDFYLFALGKEQYSDVEIPSGPVDGVLVIVLRLSGELPANSPPAADRAIRGDLLAKMAAVTREEMNNKWHVAGSVMVGSPPQPRRFNRCALQFTTQFLVENHPYGSPPRDQSDVTPEFAAKILAALPAQTRMMVVDSPPASPPEWILHPASPPNLAKLEMKVAAPGDVDWQFYEALPRFWNLQSPPRDVVAASWLPWVQVIMPGATIV